MNSQICMCIPDNKNQFHYFLAQNIKKMIKVCPSSLSDKRTNKHKSITVSLAEITTGRKKEFHML